MISPNCMSGFDSFSKGLVFQLCNCNGFMAIEKIYFLDPSQPSAPFLKLQLHRKMSMPAVFPFGQRCLWHFAGGMKNMDCLKLLCDAFCSEPCLYFQVQLAGKSSCKLAWKAGEGQNMGVFNYRSLWPGGAAKISLVKEKDQSPLTCMENDEENLLY